MELEPGGAGADSAATPSEIALRFFDLTGDMLAVVDGSGLITSVNATFARALGTDASSIAGSALSDVVGASDPTLLATHYSLLSDARPRSDFEFDAKIGGRPATLAASLHVDPGTDRRFFVARDISEQRRLSSQLEGRGNKDELGGLSNRHGFTDALQLELKMGDDVAMVHVVIDGVDCVTAEHGEPVSNQLIQAAVSRIRRNLRDTDIMARFGKAEFAILLAGSTVRTSAERLGAQLAESLRRAFGVKGARIELLSAVGISSGSASTHTADQLITEAGKAVQEARAVGQTCAVVYGQAGMAAIAASGRTNDEVRDALARVSDYDTFVQGIFSADGSGAMGVEALLTKHRPALRRLTDDSADEMLDAITSDVAGEVFSAIGPWLASQPSRRVCVNIAAPQIASSDLFVELAAQAQAHGVVARQVVCELSESTLADGAVSPQRMTEEIRRHGFQVSIDNFGHDTASLANLQSLDASYLKLDPVLVASLFTSDFHSALIRSAVDVARTMGIAVIATGVANQQQLEAVRKLGCSFVQGPGVHASEPLASFAKRVSRGT